MYKTANLQINKLYTLFLFYKKVIYIFQNNQKLYICNSECFFKNIVRFSSSTCPISSNLSHKVRLNVSNSSLSIFQGNKIFFFDLQNILTSINFDENGMPSATSATCQYLSRGRNKE